MTEEKLLLIKEKLDALGFDTKISNDGTKLGLFNSKYEYEKIHEICVEFDVAFVREQTPIYGPIDPVTLQPPIIGFIRSEYFEVND